MSHLHIVGFGIRPKNGLKIRYDWYSEFPEELKIEKDDAIILNLNEVHDGNIILKIKDIVEFIKDKGGILVIVTAPPRMLSKRFSNYDFLPWSENIIKSIGNIEGSNIRYASNAPSWVSDFLFGLDNKLLSPVYFRSIPSTAQVLMECIGTFHVSLNNQQKKGRILIIPPTIKILHGQTDSSSRSELSFYLKQIVEEMLPHFWNPSDERPSWLDSIYIRDEENIKQEFQSLKTKLEMIEEEKSILADDGHSLTRKVTSILQSLGFQAEDKETQWKEDIVITDGDFKAKLECTGKKANLNYGKFRQLIDRLFDTKGTKGIFVINPQKNLHPKDRDYTIAFADNVVKRAIQLDICLVTVPHLYRVFLDIESEDEKVKIRESLKSCKGLWKYPADDWK